MTKNLVDICNENNLNIYDNPQYGTDKHIPKGYVENFYEKTFYHIRDKEITFVEIGVRGGASIFLWKNYFSNAKIYGIDNLYDKDINNLPVNLEWLDGDNVHYLTVDAYEPSSIDLIDGEIDVLIDDGPHTIDSHVKLIELYWNKMSNNSMIIIEDVFYDPEMLYSRLDPIYKTYTEFYDYGGWDHKLIVFRIIK